MSSLHLGRRVDPHTFAPGDEELRLPVDRLVRHAVCVGMTGSGKTGLCVGLLEEVASTGVPVIAIDPKGDLANLALAFRDHRAEDFAPWVDPAEAARQGVGVDELADRTARRWREGLEAWGVDDARIARFVDGTRVTIHTPGSTAGVPVDVLAMLDAPPSGLVDDAEGLAAYVSSTVGALLGLVGVEADPVQDPQAVVLARLLTDAWTAGRTLGLEGLLPALVDPPFDKVGFFPVDDFFPRKERLALAMKLNAVAAAPSFASWREGAPLDVDALLAP
ncbi:MAG: DUF853 family protein, partial [Myxococcales bacterium]|nr:DUF853 family protein [Myxococcales bacterium]